MEELSYLLRRFKKLKNICVEIYFNSSLMFYNLVIAKLSKQNSTYKLQELYTWFCSTLHFILHNNYSFGYRYINKLVKIRKKKLGIN